MTSRESVGPDNLVDVPTRSVDPFLEAKLHWSPSRADWLRRQRLLDRMRAVREHPVSLVAAPAGYGKTILVAQWLKEARARAAWLTLDPGDNDANRLWTHVAVALDQAGCTLDPHPRQHRVGFHAAGPGSLLAATVEALSSMPEDIVIVLDDFHFIHEATCHAQVEFLVEHLPPQAHLVLVTRSDPGLRLGRLRASGALLEVRAGDLSFTHEEASALLSREHVDLGEDAVSLLVQRTEGWPAGLYLASLSLAGRKDPNAFVRDFSGANRYIGDYLTEEVLSRHSDEMRTFIMTMSILDRFSAPLCDHVAGITGSASILRELERTNLFLVPLDDEERWYRFHHLFAAVARAELEVAQPQRIRTLHTRAADWFGARGNIDEAVRHSIAAGDVKTAALLVQAHWLQFVDAGRTATVLGWLEAIGPPAEATDPDASVTAAWMAALIGDEASLTDRLTALAELRDHGPLPDGSRSVESATALIRGLFGYGGPVEMMQAAERAVELETDRHSPFYALAHAALGHAAYVAGDLDRALAHVANARHSDRAPVLAQVFVLATQSLVENERGNLERSMECAESSIRILEAHGLPDVPQVSLAFTALGTAQAVAGRLDDALVTLDRGLALRHQTSAHGPWGTIHHLLSHARAAVQAGQSGNARRLLGELDSGLARFTDGMEAMYARADAVRRLISADRAVTTLGEALTGREMDILRLLQSSMSHHEIAAALYLSPNTVKTHSRAVYRKLGVHTRAEAVLSARRHRLASGPAPAESHPGEIAAG